MTDRRIRVAHLINNLAMGGAEHFLLDLLEGFRRGGEVEPVLFLLNRSQMFYDWYDLPEVHELGFDGYWRDKEEVQKAANRAVGLLRAEGMDLLHTHLWVSDYIGAKAAREAKIPHVSHIHNTLDWYESGRIGARARRFFFSRAMRQSGAYFIGCSRAATEFTQNHLSVPPDRFTTIPYCIDTQRFERIKDYRQRDSEAPLILGMAGRFIEWKGHHLLLQALADLKGRRAANVRLLIAGDGERRGVIEKMVHDLDLGDRVVLLGRISDMPGFYRDIDVLVQPSLSSEGLPVAILESMCSGLVVLASDVAGAREAIVDGRTGYLCKPGDIKQLGERIQRLAGCDNGTLDEISIQASTWVQDNCSQEAVAARVVDVYRKILGSGSGASIPPSPGAGKD